MLRFLRFSRPGQTTPARAPRPAARFRPVVEALEGREVPSATAAAPDLAPALAAPAAAAHQAASILPITINNVVNNAGSLVANASLGATNFQIPLTLTASPSSTSSTTILHLQINPIHL